MEKKAESLSEMTEPSSPMEKHLFAPISLPTVLMLKPMAELLLCAEEGASSTQPWAAAKAARRAQPCRSHRWAVMLRDPWLWKASFQPTAGISWL